MPGGINGTVQVVQGGAIQLCNAGGGGMGRLGNVLHGDGAVGRFLCQVFQGTVSALHFFDVLRGGALLAKPLGNGTLGTKAQGAAHAVQGIVKQVHLLRVQLAGVVHKGEIFARFLRLIRAFFRRSGVLPLGLGVFLDGGGVVFDGSGIAGFCIAIRFGVFCRFPGGFVVLFSGFSVGGEAFPHLLCRFRPALHPGAQDLHPLATQFAEVAGLAQGGIKGGKFFFALQTTRNFIKAGADELAAVLRAFGGQR